MNDLREWAIALCAVAMACTALLLLLPSKGTAPLMKMLLAVFFCCCLLGPVVAVSATDWATLIPTVDSERVESEQLEQAFYDTLQAQTDAVLRDLAEEALVGTGYTIKKIEATWTESADGSIYMSGATVWLDAEQTAHAVEIGKLLNAAIGVEVRIIPRLG